MRKIALKTAEPDVDNRDENAPKIEEFVKEHGMRCAVKKRGQGKLAVNLYPKEYTDIDDFVSVLKGIEGIVNAKGQVRLNVSHSTIAVTVLI